jgi:hypothetical protein
VGIFPPRESLVSDIPAVDGKIVKLFYSVSHHIGTITREKGRGAIDLSIGPRNLRDDSISDGWSKPDFVKEILVKPMSSSATSTSSQSVSCMGRYIPFKLGLKLIFTLQQ